VGRSLKPMPALSYTHTLVNLLSCGVTALQISDTVPASIARSW